MEPRSVYYAHPMSWYGTDNEKADLQMLELEFPEAKIINPGSKQIAIDLKAWQKQNPYVGVMAFFEDIVRNVEAVAFRPFADGWIGAGVAKELLTAHIWGLPIYTIYSGCSAAICGAPKLIKAAPSTLLYDTLTIAETRERIKNGTL